jgi:hypothetical protein
VCFETILLKNQVFFPKAMFGVRVGWTHFHKTTQTNPKRVFGHGGLFAILKDMQLFISKL